MNTIHGYSDTSKFLTRKQWDSATTEQRSGFLAEGYIVRPTAAEIDEESTAVARDEAMYGDKGSL